MTFWKRENFYEDSKRSVVANGERGGKNEGANTKAFKGSKTILYAVVVGGTCHDMLTKIHRVYNTRRET